MVSRSFCLRGNKITLDRARQVSIKSYLPRIKQKVRIKMANNIPTIEEIENVWKLLEKETFVIPVTIHSYDAESGRYLVQYDNGILEYTFLTFEKSASVNDARILEYTPSQFLNIPDVMGMRMTVEVSH